MSSPFRYFRKHTKAFMAVAAVMCMFLFVFASGTGSGRSGNDGPQRNATAMVASWKGGSINEGQLENLVYQRIITNKFLQMLFVEGGGQSLYYDLPDGVPYLLLRSEDPSAVQLEVISTELFANLAADAGISVGSDMLNSYMYEFGLRRVGSDQIRGILANLGRGDERSNEIAVMATMRKLLMAYYYRRAYDDAGFVVLPSERWDDWRSVNERISVTAAALPVEGFLGEVPEPTEEQLKKLYDEYREGEPDLIYSVGGRELPSPNPGFAEPRRVKLQYLVGGVAEQTKKFLDAVTEEEIADYYERNKRLEFVKSDVADEAADFEAEEETGETPGTEDAAEGAEAEPAGGDPATDAAPVEETPPADGTAAPAETTEPATEPAEGAPSSEDATPAAGEGDQSSVEPQRSPFRLTALQAAPAEDDAEAASTEAASTEADDEESGAGVDAPTGETDPPEQSDAASDPAADAVSETPAATEADAAANDADDAEGVATTDDAAEEEPLEFEPLENVRDEIRETLARDKAVEELKSTMDKALAKILTEYNRYGRDVVVAREAKKELPKPPAKLQNLDWLATETGLTLETTAPLTYDELRETPVGTAVDEQSGRINVAGAMFVTTIALYEPFLAHELEGDWYVVLKIEDTPKRVPPFDEVRDQVAAAWKRVEAAKLAEKKAKDLATEAEGSTEPFDAFLTSKGYEVKTTELFSRRRYAVSPGLGNPPELGDIPELTNVGPELLDAAFGLEGTKATSAMNFDRSVAYVLRLNSRQYTEEELKKYFLEEVAGWPGNRDMLQARVGAFNQTLTERMWKDVAGFEFDKEWEAQREARLAERE
jgi:hypothetical protein